MDEQNFENMRPFIIVVDVIKENTDVSFRVGAYSEHNDSLRKKQPVYQVSIDEGEYIQYTSEEYKHAFAFRGKHRIKIRGEIARIELGGSKYGYQYIDVEQWGDIQWVYMDWMFSCCTRINFSAKDEPDLSRCVSMCGMFRGACEFNSPIEHWDVSHVENMEDMFEGARNFNQPIGHWDVSNVHSMERMFEGASNFNQPIGHWDVSNVDNMMNMFSGATAFNQPIGNWDTSKVNDMSYMFYHADSFNQPIGNWDTSKVNDMSYMFMYAVSFNQPIGNWDTSNVRDMKAMFAAAYQFNQPIGDWNTEKVRNMRSMFEYALLFNQPIGEWDTSHVTDMHAMFCGARSFNQDITEWDTDAVHDMNNMFIGASSFESEWHGYCLVHDAYHEVYTFRDNEILFDEPKRYNLPRLSETSDHFNAEDIHKELGLEGIFTGKDAIEMILAHQIMQDNVDANGISSGYVGLDKLIHGFEKGTLTIIAGELHMGKTALALNLVSNITLNEQIPVAYFSYDNSIVELTTKLVLIQTGLYGRCPGCNLSLDELENDIIQTRLCGRMYGNRHLDEMENDIKLIQTGLYGRCPGCNLSLDELENDIKVQLNRAIDTIAQSKIYFVDPLSPELEYLESQARVLRHEKGIQLLIVDYLQVLSIHGKTWHPDIQSSTVIPSLVIRLKRLARELDIPIIVLSQVNCSCMDRACRWPQMVDLWGAAKCADNVLFINRSGYYDLYGGNRLFIQVDKSLHKTGVCELGWESMRCRLIDNPE